MAPIQWNRSTPCPNGVAAASIGCRAPIRDALLSPTTSRCRSFQDRRQHGCPGFLSQSSQARQSWRLFHGISVVSAEKSDSHWSPGPPRLPTLVVQRCREHRWREWLPALRGSWNIFPLSPSLYITRVYYTTTTAYYLLLPTTTAGAWAYTPLCLASHGLDAAHLHSDSCWGVRGGCIGAKVRKRGRSRTSTARAG